MSGVGFRVSGFRSRVSVSVFGSQGSGFRVSGAGRTVGDGEFLAHFQGLVVVPDHPHLREGRLPVILVIISDTSNYNSNTPLLVTSYHY